MAIPREILERHLLESKKVISEKLDVIKTSAAGEYEKAKKSITVPDWIKLDINGKERPESVQRMYVEEMTSRSVMLCIKQVCFQKDFSGKL